MINLHLFWISLIVYFLRDTSLWWWNLSLGTPTFSLATISKKWCRKPWSLQAFQHNVWGTRSYGRRHIYHQMSTMWEKFWNKNKWVANYRLLKLQNLDSDPPEKWERLWLSKCTTLVDAFDWYSYTSENKNWSYFDSIVHKSYKQ